MDPEDENEEEQLKAIKEEELQKWSEIVHLIHKCKSENPADMEELLKKLMKQSELNKESLENKEIFDENEPESFADELEEESQKHEEFNSKKYIEYLDSDMYAISNDASDVRNVSKSSSDKAIKTMEKIIEMKEAEEVREDEEMESEKS